MKKMLVLALGIGLLGLFAGPSTASADSIQYVATSTYSAGTAATTYSAPSTTFSFSFTEPDTLTSLTTTSIPLTFTLGSGPATSLTGTVKFFDTTGGGLFTISALVGITNYQWEFFGPQIFSGSGPYTLSTGIFPVSGPGVSTSALFLGSGFGGNFSGGTVTATVVTSPEPSSLILLALGLSGLLLVALRKRIMSTLPEHTAPACDA